MSGSIRTCLLWFRSLSLISLPSVDFEVRSPSILKPILVLSKFTADSSFLTTPLEGYNNISERDLPYLGHWEEKSNHHLFWRGSTTGGYGNERDWKDSHRLRLHLMVNGPRGGDVWWDQQAREVMMPDGNGGFEVVRRWEKSLSTAYADVKLSGKPVQVSRPRQRGRPSPVCQLTLNAHL